MKSKGMQVSEGRTKASDEIQKNAAGSINNRNTCLIACSVSEGAGVPVWNEEITS
jgi:hypothetical protein